MQEQSIFIEALEKEDGSERAAFLDQACADDAPLRERIERLLHQHQRAEGFMESPPAALAARAGDHVKAVFEANELAQGKDVNAAVLTTWPAFVHSPRRQ